MPAEMVEAEIWVMVDEDGNYTVADTRDNLEAPAGLATRVLKLTVNVPKPRPVELVATIADEPATGELVAA